MVLGGTSLQFWFALTQKLAMLSISTCAYWPCVCLLWRNGYLGLMPIFQLGCLGFVIELYECLHIWEMKPLSVPSFANIFSQSTGGLFILFSGLFILFMSSSAVQKLVSFISPLPLFFLLFPLHWETNLRQWIGMGVVGAPIVDQRKRIWLASKRMQVRSLAWLSGLRIQSCHELQCRSQTWLRYGIAVAVVQVKFDP